MPLQHFCRSCRARLAKRRSGTRAQLLKKANPSRATAEPSTAPEEADAGAATETAATAEIAAEQPAEMFDDWASADPAPSSEVPPPIDSDLAAAADGDISGEPAWNISHYQLQQQWNMQPDADLEALLLESDSAATSATAVAAPLPAGGQAFSIAPPSGTAMPSLQQYITSPAAAPAADSGAAVKFGTEEQAAALAQVMDFLEDTDTDEEGNLDAILLQADVVAALQQELLGTNWQQQQQSVPLPGQQSVLPLGGSSMNPTSASCAAAPAAAKAGMAAASDQCVRDCGYPGPLPQTQTTAFSAASGGASATHVRGMSSVSADLLRLQSDASVTNMGGGGGVAPQAGQQQPPHAAAAHSLEPMQQQLTPDNPASGPSSSRLQWLMQQVQQELQQCNDDDLHCLKDEELNMLLLAALAPADGGAPAPGSAAAVAAPKPAASPSASAVTQEGCSLGQLAGQIAGQVAGKIAEHFQQQQQQAWVGSGITSNVAWPYQMTVSSMMQSSSPMTTGTLTTPTAMTAPFTAVPHNIVTSPMAAMAAAASPWFMHQQPQLLPSSLGVSGSVQGTTSGLSGLSPSCSGPASLGAPFSVQGNFIRPQLSYQGFSGQISNNQPGTPQLGCYQQAEYVVHQAQQQQGFMQLPGWHQQYV